MPCATAGAVKALDFAEVATLGYRHILCNTYHLALRPGLDVIRAAGGLHKFIGWGGSILTDSGGFQILSLSPLRRVTEHGVKFRSHIDGDMVEFTPESVVDSQLAFDSDIAMVLDVCSPYPTPPKKLRRDLDITVAWAHRAREHWDSRSPDGNLIFGILQGGMSEGLRRRAAHEIAPLGFDGYAVGGLSVGESRDEFHRVAELSASLLPEDKPRYIMGVGMPEDIVRCIGYGYDMFDCVAPTRMARNGVAFTRRGQLSIRKADLATDFAPLDEGCACFACKSHTRACIHHLYKSHEILSAKLLTLHNLAFYKRLMTDAAAAIEAGRYGDWAGETLAELGGST
jgi:queuine tRNA-ribosyltransferase